MNSMSLAGQRAAVLWNKGGFVGSGRKFCYDAFVCGFGFIIPFQIRELVHVWDLPQTRFGSCKAIRLRPDPAFRRSVVRQNWWGGGAIVLGIAGFVLAGKVHLGLGFLLIFAAIALGAVAYFQVREGPRHRKIRLLLGPHAWGPSDPATWHKSICKDIVDPQKAFEVKSFAVLAREAIEDGRWGHAMWAARLCAAVEDREIGDDLTDEILEDEEVKERLPYVSRNPHERNDEFGKPPRLEPWITCVPGKHVFRID